MNESDGEFRLGGETGDVRRAPYQERFLDSHPVKTLRSGQGNQDLKLIVLPGRGQLCCGIVLEAPWKMLHCDGLTEKQTRYAQSCVEPVHQRTLVL